MPLCGHTQGDREENTVPFEAVRDGVKEKCKNRRSAGNGTIEGEHPSCKGTDMPSRQTSEVLQHLRRAVLLSEGAGLTDGQLLEDFIRHRDESALAALVRRHAPMVWGVCRRVLRDHQDAEDAFQVTFLVLVRKAACVNPTEMVGNWLYGVAHQTALKTRATAARRKLRERQVTQMPEPAVPEADLWEDLQPLLDQELSRLPDKYRVAIVLCDLEGKTHREAARQLGVPDGTLSARLSRGRAMLARRLARRGLAVSGTSLAAVLAENAASATAPASVVSSTIKAASLLAAGQVASVVLSAKAAAVMKGVLTTMLLNKIRTAMALVLMLCTCAGAALAFLPGAAGQPEAAKTAKATAGAKAPPASAAPKKPLFPDLTKIDRTIVREPTYKTQPFYALLAMGPEAKKRVWLVVDGDTLYVDRNGNGDLTERKNRVRNPKKGEFAPGMYKHFDSYDLGTVEGLHLQLNYWVRDRDFVPDNDFEKRIRKNHEENGWEFSTLFRINADGTKSGQIPLCFCRRPQDCQVSHLGGRLTFALRAPEFYPLERHSEKNSLNLMIGTPGLPARKWEKPVFAPLGTGEVPKNVHPVAKFEFPHKKEGEPPIKLEFVLKERC
jgi:RNA polymerase sigma factor (sigma-70 family)